MRRNPKRNLILGYEIIKGGKLNARQENKCPFFE